MGKIFKNSNGGARLKRNLFVQPDEPKVKDGLWIKAPEKKRIRSIVAKDNFFIANTLIADELCEFSHAPMQQRFIRGNYSRCYKSKWLYYAVCKYVAQYDYRIAVHRYNVITDTDEEVFVGEKDATSYIAINTAFIDGKMYSIGGSQYGTNAFKPLYDMDNEEVLYSKSGVGSFTFNSSGIWSEGSDNVLICLGKYADEIYMYGSDVERTGCIYTYNVVTGTVRAICKGINSLVRGVGGGDNSIPDDKFQGTGEQTTNMFVFKDNFLYVFGRMKVGFCFNLSNSYTTLDSSNSFTIPFGNSSDWTGNLKTIVVAGELYVIYAPKNVSRIINTAGYYHSDIYKFDFASKTFSMLFSLPERYVVNIASYIPNYGIFMKCLDTSEARFPAKQLAFTSKPEAQGTLCLQLGDTYGFRLFDITRLYSSMPSYVQALLTSGKYKNQNSFYIDDAWMCEGDFERWPAYIGDGTKWRNFKN